MPSKDDLIQFLFIFSFVVIGSIGILGMFYVFPVINATYVVWEHQVKEYFNLDRGHYGGYVVKGDKN